jgi:hypothetical protein
MKKQLRGVSLERSKSEEPIIAYTYEPYEDNNKDERLMYSFDSENLHTPYCAEDGIQYIFHTQVSRGFADFEELKCPLCKGKLRKDFKTECIVSSTTIPKLFSCLIPDYTSKTLFVVLTVSESEGLINAIVKLLSQQNLSKSFKRLVISQSYLSSRKNLKLSEIKAYTSTQYWVKSISMKKLDEKKRVRSTRQKEENEVLITNLAKEFPLISKKRLALVRRDLKLWPTIIPKFSKKKFKIKTKNLSRRMKSLKKDLLFSKKTYSIAKQVRKETELDCLSQHLWNYSTFRPKGKLLQMMRTGSISKKK